MQLKTQEMVAPAEHHLLCEDDLSRALKENQYQDHNPNHLFFFFFFFLSMNLTSAYLSCLYSTLN